MKKHVRLEVATFSKLLVTHVTFVWFLASMCKHVCLKIAT